MLCVGGEYTGNSFFVNRNSYGEILGSGSDMMLTLRLDDVEVEEEHLRLFCDSDKYFVQNVAAKQPVWVSLRPLEVGLLEAGGGGTAKDWLFHSRYKMVTLDPTGAEHLEFRVGPQTFTLTAQHLQGPIKNRFVLRAFLQAYGGERYLSVFAGLKLMSLDEVELPVLEKCDLKDDDGERMSRDTLKEFWDRFLADVTAGAVCLTLKVDGRGRDWVYCRTVAGPVLPLCFRMDERELCLHYAWIEGRMILGAVTRRGNLTEEHRAFVRLPFRQPMEVLPSDEVIIGRQILRVQRANVGMAQLIGTKPTMEDYSLVEQGLVVPGLEAHCASVYAIFDG